MHIPDNYLSPSTCVVFGGIMIPIWRRAALKVKQELSRKRLPMLGICAAFSFLIMMFNLPLPGGTTGHAVGAVLISILLGPYAAIISVTIALAVQALFFGDGGILAFGVNAFNMAFIMPTVGYMIYRLIKGRSDRMDYTAAFTAAYTGIVASAFCAAVEFGIQPLLFKDGSGRPIYCPYPLKVSIPAMVIPHMLVVGIIEGLFTVGIYSYIKKLSPEAIYSDSKSNRKPVYGLIAALILISPIGLIAGGTAWGEWGSSKLKSMIGFVPESMANGLKYSSIMHGYRVGGLPVFMGYILSAAAGTVILIVIFRLLGLKSGKKE